MACEKYQSIIVTVSGSTPSNPYGMVAAQGDYSEWRNLATTLTLKAKARIDRFTGNIPEAGVEAAQLTVRRYNDLVERIGELPSVFEAMITFSDGLTWGSTIQRAVDASKEATCVMEDADVVLEGAGISPPSEPTAPTPAAKPPDFGTIANTLVWGAIGIGTAYLIFQIWKMER